MKVLIISANFLPASPSGPAYIAGTLKQFLAGELPIMQPSDDGAELEKHRHHDH